MIISELKRHQNCRFQKYPHFLIWPVRAFVSSFAPSNFSGGGAGVCVLGMLRAAFRKPKGKSSKGRKKPSN
jgi:hypothetical protein